MYSKVATVEWRHDLVFLLIFYLVLKVVFFIMIFGVTETFNHIQNKVAKMQIIYYLTFHLSYVSPYYLKN